jgi:hypothetical protein
VSHDGFCDVCRRNNLIVDCGSTLYNESRLVHEQACDFGAAAGAAKAGGAVKNMSAVAAWKWVMFECHADPGSSVFIGGTFNQWKPSCFHRLRDKKRDGSYRTLLQLKKGRHEYRFLVNGEWLFNPDLPLSAPCEDAAVNNTIEVA